MSTIYALHGLVVASEVSLDALVSHNDSPEVTIRMGERRAVPDKAPGGDVIAALELPGAASSLTAQEGGYTVRINNLCDFEIDGRLAEMTVHLAPHQDDEAASLLAGGALAALMALRGITVLHASAVEMPEGAVAFVANSGGGKSTVAAICCAAGARLVSDDVLRVEVENGEAFCHRGSSELRLRPQAAELAERVGEARRSTIDQRTAALAPTTGSERLTIAAIVNPRCDHGGEKLEITRLRGPEALFELVRYPRTLGWRDQEPARRDFHVLAQIADLVPVFRASLPWGPPFRADLGQELLGRLSAP